MRKVVTAILVLIGTTAAAQVTLKGLVTERGSGGLPSAHILVYPDSITTTSAENGRYVLKLAKGSKRIIVSFVGYRAFQLSLSLRNDTTVNIALTPDVNQLDEIVISGERNFQQEIFDGNRTGTHVLTKEEINSIPVLGGEADVIKTLQLLPGTIRGVEGTSDLFVRGGQADQNLVLLDGAPIYNTSHLFGFLSVFNPDILEKVEAINGGFPAEYGGRLSSILDVQSASRLSTKTRFSGDIGLIASRLFIEQPLVKNKASLWLAGRRTYIDKVLALAGQNVPYFFYDVNGKLILRPSTKDEVEISHYSGDDVLDLFRDRNGDGDGFITTFKSGNSSQSVKWNHFSDSHWTSTFSLFRTAYDYNIRNAFEENELGALSKIEDLGMRAIFSRDSIRGRGVFRGGVDVIRHAISPSVVNTAGTVSEFFGSSSTQSRVAYELGGHAQYEWSLAEDLRINTGMRLSAGAVEGKTYFFPEPRISLRYSSRDGEAFKLSYSRMAQYVHRISNSAVSTPTDIWYPVTEQIRPQSSHQVGAAYNRTIKSNTLYFSAETYYKTMYDLIGFQEGTNLFFNTDFESKLIQGRGRAYGLELLLKKQNGRLTGWLSYTLSWAWRNFSEINEGEWFPSRYDRRHNGALVMQYAITKRLSLSSVWEFVSGSRFTPVIGQYSLVAPSFTGVELIPVFSEINGVKLADTHRLDLGIKWRSKPEKKFQWHWFAGVYNVYNRANPVGINIEQDETDGSLRYTQPGLVGLLPFISYGFRW